MTGLVSFILVFGLVVFVHELGHLLVAKAFGVRVEEFGFGYPPRLAKLGEIGGTEITLNLLPLGGFVRMHEDDPTVPGGIASRSRKVRAAVFAAGAVMNLLLAALLYGVTYMRGALEPVEAPGAGIYSVSADSPAEEAGLRPGDNIVTIDGEVVGTVEQAVELISDAAGKPIVLGIERDGTALPPIMVTPRVDPPPGEGALGVTVDLPLARVSYPVWQAIPLGFRATYYTVRGIFWGIQQALMQRIPLEVTGPIGIYRMTTEVAETGLTRLLEFTAFLSVNLFLLNLLPLPALDGGRLVFVLLEWLRGGRRIPPEKEGLVHAIGMVLILAMMVVVTVFDYMRYFG
ncbi:MAG: M50 family metallopeptidase [Anaerolineae bacterium]